MRQVVVSSLNDVIDVTNRNTEIINRKIKRLEKSYDKKGQTDDKNTILWCVFLIYVGFVGIKKATINKHIRSLYKEIERLKDLAMRGE